jgi:hypothetical protein
MKDVVIRSIKEIGIVDRYNEYVGVRLSGLIGDIIHASTRFDHIMKKYPKHPWLVIHSYPQPRFEERIKSVSEELLYPFFKEGRIAYYFCSGSGKGGASYNTIREVVDGFRFCRIPPDRIFECLYKLKKLPNMDHPNLGINLAVKKDPKKVVIFRYSSWHSHFPERNRPYSEWKQIEEYLLEQGYDVYLLGLDDKMKVTPGVQDFRGYFKLRTLLEFCKDASLCISVATFLYQWTQHICPTAVLSDARDCTALNGPWKLTDKLHVINVNSEDYLSEIFHFINSSTKKVNI